MRTDHLLARKGVSLLDSMGRPLRGYAPDHRWILKSNFINLNLEKRPSNAVPIVKKAVVLGEKDLER